MRRLILFFIIALLLFGCSAGRHGRRKETGRSFSLVSRPDSLRFTGGYKEKRNRVMHIERVELTKPDSGGHQAIASIVRLKLVEQEVKRDTLNTEFSGGDLIVTTEDRVVEAGYRVKGGLWKWISGLFFILLLVVALRIYFLSRR